MWTQGQLGRSRNNPGDDVRGLKERNSGGEGDLWNRDVF